MSKFVKYVCVALCLAFVSVAQAQQRSFSESELQLNKYFLQLKKDTVVENRHRVNDSIYAVMNELLQRKVSLEYAFKSTEGLKKLVSSDGRVAVYSWCYMIDEEHLVFSGIVQRRGARGMEIYPLKAQQQPFVPKDNRTLNADEWYGALYFDIFPFRSKQGKAYLLLGWSQNVPSLTMKTIDVLWFDEEGAHFGLPAFEVLKEEFLSRVVFQYSREVSMTLLYEAHNRRFVFDHLAPVNSGFVGDYRYYAPDSSYDAYKKKSLKRTWLFQQNVDVENN